MQKIPQSSADQALVRVPGNASLEGSTTDSPKGGASPFSVLHRHPFLALAIFLSVSGLGVPFVRKIAKPVYFANSVIYVSPTFDGTLKEDRGQRPQYDIQQKMLAIPRYDIVLRTIQRLRARGIDPRLPNESDQAAAERFGRTLEVTHAFDSYEISVGLHSDSPWLLADFLNALTATFIEATKSQEQYGEDRRVETLNSERSRLESELTGALESRSEIARNLGVVGFEQLPADRLVETARSSLDQARRERIQAEAEVAMLERDATLATELAAESPVPSNLNEVARKESLLARRAEVQDKLADIKPLHPDYRGLARELARIEDQLKEISAEQVVVTRRADQPTSHLLAAARIELERARKAETELNLELTRDIARVDSTAGEFQRGRDLDIRVEQLRNQINAIDDRLSYFRVEMSAPPSIRISSQARTPLVPEKNNRKKYLGGLMLFAVVASFGGVLLLDITRSCVLTANDVEKIVGFPPLGVLLLRETGTQYFAQEQFSRMINNVERVFKGSGVRVFVFTSVGVRGSNSRLTAGIARELQRRHIRAVALPPDSLRQGIRVAEAQHLRDNGYPYDSSHPTSGFAGRIEEMLLSHELILVDAPPLLLSAETECLTAIAGVTVLTVQAGKVSMKELKRAAALMESLRPAGIAAILLGVSMKSPDSQLRRNFREFESFRKARRGASPLTSGIELEGEDLISGNHL